MLPSPKLRLQLTSTQGNSLVVQELFLFKAMGFIGCMRQLINCSYNVREWT